LTVSACVENGALVLASVLFLVIELLDICAYVYKRICMCELAF